MTRLERVQNAMPGIMARRRKTEAFDTVVPAVLSNCMQLANGDTAKGREVAALASPLSEFMEIRPWQKDMFTNPGDLVYDPNGKYVYMYSGKDAMTHSNQTFYPGAAGVYYWAIIPEVYEECKVYPNISGIIVAVKQNEIWWNTAKTKKYRWTGADNNACSWHPGQAGVHQWAEVT